MSDYQFYSIMFLLWLIVSYLITSPFVAVVAVITSVGYLVASFYAHYKEE